MILVGYEKESSNDRLWDQLKRKIYISANVRFDEADFPNQESEDSDIHLKLVFENEVDVLQPSIDESVSYEDGENEDNEDNATQLEKTSMIYVIDVKFSPQNILVQ
ncbi:hypothetical protein JTB14_031982 [Gonioctena quinquepunctata]|nr:hypothetical protein JTB14_031982 [Gonioctena quinquepunctata]